jgi:hypothetical protein
VCAVGDECGWRGCAYWKRREGVSTLRFAEERNPSRVLEPDRNPRTLVVIIHEEAINQFLGITYFGGVFSEGEVSVRAMDYILENPYPVGLL